MSKNDNDKDIYVIGMIYMFVMVASIILGIYESICSYINIQCIQIHNLLDKILSYVMGIFS